MNAKQLEWTAFVVDGAALEYCIVPGEVRERAPGSRLERREVWDVLVRPAGSDAPGRAGVFPRAVDVGVGQAIDVARMFAEHLAADASHWLARRALVSDLQAQLGADAVRVGFGHLASHDARAAADALAAQMNLHPLADAWQELERSAARELLAEMFRVELAYGTTLMPPEDADTCSDRWFALFSPGARFFTNCDLAQQTWHPLTAATFDRGLAVVDSAGVGIVCVTAED